MKTKLFTLLLLFVSVSIMAQNEKIALLEPLIGAGSTAVEGVEKAMIRGELRKALVKFAGYEAITRTDIDAMMKEQDFQRKGYVSDDQIKKIGVMSGADYICVSAVTKYKSEFYLEAYLIQVEKGTMYNPATQFGELVDGKVANMYPICQALAQELLGGSSIMGTQGGPRNGSYHSGGNKQDFTETAWDINMKMIWVEGGDFMMGCTSEQGNCDSDEQNVRRVTVDGFYIGMLEVTQSQWEKVMGTSIYQQRNKANPQFPMRGVGPDYPIYYVSWDEATEFCRLLSNKTGRTYTLPTEAQWEYAARGGKKADGTKYAGSNVIDAVAWYTDNSGSTTHVCGSKRANALGIYDMSGNVWEWCKDWYASSYVSYDTNNPTGPSSGSIRVVRGGSWNDNASNCRVAFRGSFTPLDRYDDLGFRVVLLP